VLRPRGQSRVKVVLSCSREAATVALAAVIRPSVRDHEEDEATGILSFLLRNRVEAEPEEPKLSAASLDRWRQLSTRKRRRLLREADESATTSLSVDPTRDFVANRDASIELELSGVYRQMAAATKNALQNPGDYVSEAAADAFMFGQTGSVAFLPTGWRGPKDERDLTLAATDEEYWAATYPPELFNPKVAEAYLLGVASKKEAPAK
jgi:hypothetical protein